MVRSESRLGQRRRRVHRIEFIARSSHGDRICVVTAEEYDYWVVSLDL
ncbi:hypothetical protein [Streptomyces goshikiensis]